MQNRPLAPNPRAATAAAALLLGVAAGGARAAAAETPAVAVALFAVASQPGDARSRGLGAGAAVRYRLTDQLGATADVARVAARDGGFTAVGAGFQAVLDSTPIAPFLALSLVGLGPRKVSQVAFASRLGAGADVRLSRWLSLGLEARRLTPLSGAAGPALDGGTEVLLRMVLFPSLLR
ncbi:MAG: hypothetical protein NVS2B9_12330 [Myxococcales bacterium]